MQWRTPKGLRAAERASEESDAPTARPEAHASARERDDDPVGERRPRVSDRYGKADETARSDGSVERSGIERGRHRRDAKRIAMGARRDFIFG